MNCSYYKVCRQRPKCMQDDSWWGYWGYDYGGCSPCYQPKPQRFRICNATQDSEFSADQFLSDMSYYDSCDCAIFVNCTNTTTVIPPITPPSGEVPPVTCNYTCQDIIAIQTTVKNLTTLIDNMQDEIDMLIGQYQSIVQRVTVIEQWQVNVTTNINIFDQEINELFCAANKCSSQSVDQTLATIRDKGVRFGDFWWMGAQGEYAFVMDLNDASYYRFSPNNTCDL